MDFFYKVEMFNQWRPGVGGVIDLNCGWYCQDALLKWYCKKNYLPSDIFTKTAKCNRMSFGFDPEESFCQKINIINKPEKYKEELLRHGPIIAAIKSRIPGLNLGHYVLIVGVRVKQNEIIIYNPLSINLHSVRKSKPTVMKFKQFMAILEGTLILNQFSVNCAMKMQPLLEPN
ncbi:hypothetical protein RYR28_002967 [Edwardsiella piscicida]|uniref:Papain-like cysteine protease family protein n=2 Tax=Edwardsiella piscicida TaxID=1263550 RepID=A0AAQ3BZL8_EDWPI|nr:papain-like cysteine protease family protein [Edwardsiella piscicida]ACY84874.1 hypothetical protein ETAE_2037 [Edwardsiella tarda EIB202]AGH73987.1 hypothetical protein ETAC_09330 [Edwardsiella piscicida C07-087]AOP43271.1 hypothetical protein A9797_09700 [Edwardsiella piscicida]ARD19672.1 hypothetical protein BXA22_15610 [Edwardsiella piscicida]EKS7765862.1 hypothetical protein [Edwardsiella piscicida]